MRKSDMEKDQAPERFDQYLDKLRSIVEKMEQGGLGLEDSLTLFEEGIGLSRRLFGMLNSAEGQVEELLATMERIPFNKEEN